MDENIQQPEIQRTERSYELIQKKRQIGNFPETDKIFNVREGDLFSGHNIIHCPCAVQ